MLLQSKKNISLFTDSFSVEGNLLALKRERIESPREWIVLGSANGSPVHSHHRGETRRTCKQS